MSDRPENLPLADGPPGEGVLFPRDPDGRRSTSATGRAVVAAALRGVDPVGAQEAERETSWRSGYLPHLRRLVEAGLSRPDDAVGIARSGLAAAHDRLVHADSRGEETSLAQWARHPRDPAGPSLQTLTLRGRAAPERTLTLPLHGRRLEGTQVREQLDRWVAAGVAEPTLAEAVGAVLDHPEWLRCEGRTVAVLGAGAEMGPLQALLRWGAEVAAVDLPAPTLTQRLVDTAEAGAGTVHLPVAAGGPLVPDRAGVNLTRDAIGLADWLADLRGPLVLGNYVYADGAQNVTVSAAVDAASTRPLAARPDTALAFLATPTDVFAVPADAVAQSVAAYQGRSTTARYVGRPLRTVSGGRLLRRAYVPGSDPGIADSLVPQQGPNYALAKRLQRWRATAARAEGALVSMNVAPPTRTRSVVKNRALAAAYAGAHRFGVEVFEPATSNVLMAALLVHDLHTGGGPRHEHPWQDEAYAAVHGGLWRAAYAPRSALGLAALLGYGSARG